MNIRGMGLMIAILAAVNVCSAVGVIYLKHLNRQQYIDISKQQRLIDELDVEWSQLKIEEGTFSSHALVESVASDRLNMVFPSLNDTIMITH